MLNAANEVAVERFLKGEITFDKITKIVAQTLEKVPHKNLQSISEVLEFDNSARLLAFKL